MGGDPRLAAFARRHGLDAQGLSELATLVSHGGVDPPPSDDPSRTRAPIEESRAPDADTLDAPIAAAACADFALGDTRHAILGRLGSGGQGDVYRVFDRKMGRPLAMKVLRSLASADARARFRAEAALTVGLEHPGIVPIYDQGLTLDGRPWYTMQILEAADLGVAGEDADEAVEHGEAGLALDAGLVELELHAADLDGAVAGVAEAVVVDVTLVDVGDGGAVVAGVAEAVGVAVLLLGVGDFGAEVAGVADAIAVAVELLGVGDVGAAVAGVADAITVAVRAAGVAGEGDADEGTPAGGAVVFGEAGAGAGGERGGVGDLPAHTDAAFDRARGAEGGDAPRPTP